MTSKCGISCRWVKCTPQKARQSPLVRHDDIQPALSPLQERGRTDDHEGLADALLPISLYTSNKQVGNTKCQEHEEQNRACEHEDDDRRAS